MGGGQKYTPNPTVNPRALNFNVKRNQVSGVISSFNPTR